MTGNEYYKNVAIETNWPSDDLCDPPSDPRKAIHVLIEHFLGPEWYVVMPENDDQVITNAVSEILDKYEKTSWRSFWDRNRFFVFFTIANVLAAIINLWKG